MEVKILNLSVAIYLHSIGVLLLNV